MSNRLSACLGKKYTSQKSFSCLLTSPSAQQTNTLNTMLSYHTAVFNTIVRGGYLEKMVSFQAQIDKQIDTDNLKFTKEFLTFSTKSANMSKDVDTLVRAWSAFLLVFNLGVRL